MTERTQALMSAGKTELDMPVQAVWMATVGKQQTIVVKAVVVAPMTASALKWHWLAICRSGEVLRCAAVAMLMAP